MNHRLQQQAFMNLLLNAVEAMGHGGKPDRDSSESNDAKVRIFIRDTGGGIAPENFTHIFETFFTTQKERHRTWLSLSPGGVVDEHQGEIEVASETGPGLWKPSLSLCPRRETGLPARTFIDPPDGTSLRNLRPHAWREWP